MLPENCFELFKAPCLDKPSHMMTDIPFWMRQFAMLSDGGTKGLNKVMTRQTSYLDKLKQKGLQGKGETQFFGQMTHLNKTIAGHLDKLVVCISGYAKTEKRLKRYTDDSSKSIKELDYLYSKAQESLRKQTKVVEKQRKKYHEIAFRVEAAEIKAELADGPKTLNKTLQNLAALRDRMESRFDKYSNEIGKWKFIFSRVRMLADEYESAYVSREASRANLVLSCLQDMADRTIASNIANWRPAFTDINEPRFVRERLIERETIQIQTLQTYIGEIGKSDMYERATAWLKDSNDICKNNSSQADETDSESRDLEEKFTINRKLSDLTAVFEATREYHKQHTNQLSLKPGDIITQILPENEKGFAFGRRTHGIFKKTQEGFFPISHVFLIKGFREISHI